MPVMPLSLDNSLNNKTSAKSRKTGPTSTENILGFVYKVRKKTRSIDSRPEAGRLKSTLLTMMNHRIASILDPILEQDSLTISGILTLTRKLQHKRNTMLSFNLQGYVWDRYLKLNLASKLLANISLCMSFTELNEETRRFTGYLSSSEQNSGEPKFFFDLVFNQCAEDISGTMTVLKKKKGTDVGLFKIDIRGYEHDDQLRLNIETKNAKCINLGSIILKSKLQSALTGYATFEHGKPDEKTLTTITIERHEATAH